MRTGGASSAVVAGSVARWEMWWLVLMPLTSRSARVGAGGYSAARKYFVCRLAQLSVPLIVSM
jgi:hypothetical protein